MTEKPYLKIFSLTSFVLISFFAITSAAVYPKVSATEIPEKYIVVLKDAVNDSDLAINDIEKKHGVAAEMRYSKVLKGFSASLTTTKVAKLKADSRVLFVSEDRKVTIGGKSDANKPLPPQASERAQAARTAEPGQVPANTPAEDERNVDPDGNGRGKKGGNSGATTTLSQPVQQVPTSIRRVRADNLTNKGTGVGIAVLDTGIDFNHPDLVTNIASSTFKNCVSNIATAQDDNGHGTHVAGMIAAANNSIGVVGVAPEAKLYAVKVLDSTGSGTWSSVICGVDWVTANAKALNIKVANMSLGGTGASDNNCGLSNSDALHRAICNSAAQGVTYVVAAGNSAVNATQHVPAAYDDAVITVSALADSDGQFGGFGTSTSYGADDTFAKFSNYGTPVDVAAPGVNIYSTWKGGTYNTISGTSMATPHVAGAAALYLKNNPTATWNQVRDALRYFGESLGAGHSDPSGLHPEPVISAILP
jgi:subtilisin